MTWYMRVSCISVRYLACPSSLQRWSDMHLNFMPTTPLVVRYGMLNRLRYISCPITGVSTTPSRAAFAAVRVTPRDLR